MSTGRARRPPARHHKRGVPAGCPLSANEYAVLRALARGWTQNQIAHARGLTRSTIRRQCYDAYGRLGVANASQAVSVMLSAGWLDPIETDWHDERVTPAQRLYSDAVDRFLADQTPENRARMRHMYRAMLYECDLPDDWTPSGRALGSPDPLARIVRDVAGFMLEDVEGP